MLHFTQLFNRFGTPTRKTKINKTNCRLLQTLDHNYRAAPKSVFWEGELWPIRQVLLPFN